MHSIKQLMEILGLTENQIRDRIRALGPEFERYTRHGAHNRLLINNNGLELLKRLTDLEQSGLTVTDAAQQINHEIGVETTHKLTESEAESGVATRYIDHLEQELERRDKEIERLHEEIARLHDMLNRQLPGKISPWWRRLLGKR